MRTAAVIAEFNPLHTGHQMLLRRCREEAGADCVVVVMSGNFVQRGEPACLDRRVRTKAALLSGADVVLELPLPYAMATAERFAFGSVSLLTQLGGIDLLAFGSESGELAQLLEAAGAAEQAEGTERFRQLLDSGVGFAQARQLALEETAGMPAAMLRSPNNALAVEYLRQLHRQESFIQPFTIRREGAGYHSLTAEKGFASASMLRRSLWDGDMKTLAHYMTEDVFQLVAAEVGAGKLADPALGERAVLARLRTMKDEELLRLPDCSEGIENRLKKVIREACTVGQLCDKMKTKRYSMARVRRLVYSAFLGIDGDLCREKVPYAHLLGFTPEGARLLSQWKETSSIPVSQSLRQLEKLGGSCERFARLEGLADDLYALFQKSPHPCGYAYTAPVVVTDGRSK